MSDPKDFVALCEAQGFELMPWQKEMIKRIEAGPGHVVRHPLRQQDKKFGAEMGKLSYLIKLGYIMTCPTAILLEHKLNPARSPIRELARHVKSNIGQYVFYRKHDDGSVVITSGLDLPTVINDAFDVEISLIRPNDEL